MAAFAAVLLWHNAPVPAAQVPKSETAFAESFVPVGVLYDTSTDDASVRRDAEYLQKLRFNAIAFRFPDPSTGSGQAAAPLRVERLSNLLGGSVTASGHSGVEIVPVGAAADVRARAWQAVGRGAAGIIFDGWRALKTDPAALAAAAQFADIVTRNQPLFAPLKPRVVQGDIAIDRGAGDIDARFLESPAAMMLIAVNVGDAERSVTMTFGPAMPEAIWQNMESGTAVNFVASAKGPTYTRTFAPKDVLVLMIKKQWR
jgi:hypothetical protein